MLKKILGLFICLVLSVSVAFASKLPIDVQGYLKKTIQDIDIRFDGVIIFPDGTVYLPVYPASSKKVDELEITETYPAGETLKDKPEVVIFNNDFVLLKVITVSESQKTVHKFDKPPVVIKTGILPQDMLVPSGLIIPENIKSIVGNLDIKLEPEKNIKVDADVSYSAKVFDSESKAVNKYDNKSTLKSIQDKNLYMVSSYSKNISVVNGEHFKADYALSQVATPIDAQLTADNKFLLVTSYDSTLLNVISIADDRIIKQLDLTSQGGEIIIDKPNHKAYIAAPNISTVYVLDTETMKFIQKIKLNGRCEKLTLNENYLMYVDKISDNIWSIELNNQYTLRNLGKFPNVSKVIYNKGLVYLSSRTKSRVAVIDYTNRQLVSEFDTVEKPVDMLIYNNILYVLGANYNQIQAINTSNNEPIGVINIEGDGFSTKMCPVPNTSLVLVTDTKVGRYTVVDLEHNQVIKTNGVELPVNSILVGKKVVKIK